MFSLIRRNFRNILKYFIFILLESIIFSLIVDYIPGIVITDYPTTFILLSLLFILNAILWPLLSYYSLSFLVFTLGFGTFLLDGIILWLLSMVMGGWIAEGFTIEGFALFTVPLIIGLTSSILSIVLSFNINDSYYRNVLRRRLVAENKYVSDKCGYIFLEIDGLAEKVLKEAMDKGYMPTLSSWIDNTHCLTSWECDLSSQTGSSQAGILHGNNNNIPAFRWVEKENDNRIVSSNGLKDAELIENRISDSHGLLSVNGASRSNLFSGDAKDQILTYSKFGHIRNFYSKTWYYLYSTPFVMAKMLILFIGDMLLEVISRLHHLFKYKYRIHRGLSYFVARAGANVVMREATTYAIVGDVYAAQYDVIYATYMGYDEIAHHSGIRDFDSLYSLRQIDRQFEIIQNAVKDSRREYKIIVLSDHGQSNGPTFKQKYKKSLNELVEENLPRNVNVHSILHSNDDHFREAFHIKPYAELNKQKLDEKRRHIREQIKNEIRSHNILDDNQDNTTTTLSNQEGDMKTLEKLRNKIHFLNSSEPIIDRLKTINEDYELYFDLDDEVKSDEDIHSIVLASGNLGLIYFTNWSGRMTYEQIEDAFPNLINTLKNHPGIGFIMLKSFIYGTIVLSDDNIYYMDEDYFEGENFLEKYGKNITDHLRRTDSFKYVPDILVNSTYDMENDEVYAFEELIGSHGGVGGTQQKPFIVYPNTWNLDEEIVGAENVHKFFKRNIL